MTKVVIAHEHPIMVWSLRTLLEKRLGLSVVGDANDTSEWMQLVDDTRPDVLLVSLSLIDDRSTISLNKLKEYSQTMHIGVLSSRQCTESSVVKYTSVVNGWILEFDTLDVVSQKIHRLIQGYQTPEISDAIYAQPLQSDSQLTQRELQVLRLSANSKTITEIAAHLSISPRTVEVYKGRLKQKLGLRNQTELIMYALRNDLLSMN